MDLIHPCIVGEKQYSDRAVFISLRRNKDCSFLVQRKTIRYETGGKEMYEEDVFAEAAGASLG